MFIAVLMLFAGSGVALWGVYNSWRRPGAAAGAVLAALALVAAGLLLLHAGGS